MSDSAIRALVDGQLDVEGRLPWSSNYTFLLSVNHDNVVSKAVYKPADGEQSLWDFPPGLFKREVAAYVLASSLGWPNVPETVVRSDAPFGIGSLQRFVPSDFEQHYFTLVDDVSLRSTLAPIAVFDIVANNADRKAGHCLAGDDGKIWSIDHGVCFNAEPKLRTVIWEFGGEVIAENLIDDLQRMVSALPEKLDELLAPEEVDALTARIQALVSNPVFPKITSQRQYPWPLV